ncbi:unnamed protein product [Caenorhabditis sp. 36 PRJEB53466]|nr:unnamed protein product [Caenorhabditis sp. 36 PRJEB53466]
MIDNIKHDDPMINVNEVFLVMKPCKKSIKSIVKTIANVWMNFILPKPIRAQYSMADNPLKYTPVPIQIVNGPLWLMPECVKVTGMDKEVLIETMTHLYMNHLTYLCDQARADMKNLPEAANNGANDGQKSAAPTE